MYFHSSDLVTSANSGSYGNDALNSLQSEIKANSQNTFTYDPVGNRLSKASENTTTSTTETQTLSYSTDSNRLATHDTSSISYDNNGNILQDGTKYWTYNTIDTESSLQMTVTGTLIDGSEVNSAAGTNCLFA